jgi:hypothetical protein
MQIWTPKASYAALTEATPASRARSLAEPAKAALSDGDSAAMQRIVDIAVLAGVAESDDLEDYMRAGDLHSFLRTAAEWLRPSNERLIFDHGQQLYLIETHDFGGTDGI